MSLTSEISLGNLLSMGTVVVGISVGWATLRAEVTAMHTSDKRLEALIEQARADATQREARIRALELGAGRTEEKLISILATLNRIEQQLAEGGGR